jgi:hypothetical protein
LLLQDAYDDNLAHLDELLAAWRSIVSEFAAAGIVAVPLKGLHANLDGWWRDPGARAMVDLDILVPAKQAAAAAALLDGSGFLAAPGNDWADHHLPQRWREGSRVCVEVHTALTTARWQGVLPAADVLRHDRTRLSTTHAVIHLIAHAQLHHEAHRLRALPLGPLLETAVVAASARGAEIDWEEVRARFVAGRAERALDAHLELARSLFGAAIPQPQSRLRAKAHAILCKLDLEHPTLHRGRAPLVYGRRAFAGDRMRLLYGQGNLWALRWRHLRARRLWRHLVAESQRSHPLHDMNTPPEHRDEPRHPPA